MLRFDSYILDPRSGELRKEDRVVKLQPQPFRVPEQSLGPFLVYDVSR